MELKVLPLSHTEAYNPYTVPAYVYQSFEQTLTLRLGLHCHFVILDVPGNHSILSVQSTSRTARPYFDYDRMVERSYAMACLGSWVIDPRATNLDT